MAGCDGRAGMKMIRRALPAVSWQSRAGKGGGHGPDMQAAVAKRRDRRSRQDARRDARQRSHARRRLLSTFLILFGILATVAVLAVYPMLWQHGKWIVSDTVVLAAAVSVIWIAGIAIRPGSRPPSRRDH